CPVASDGPSPISKRQPQQSLADFGAPPTNRLLIAARHLKFFFRTRQASIIRTDQPAEVTLWRRIYPAAAMRARIDDRRRDDYWRENHVTLLVEAGGSFAEPQSTPESQDIPPTRCAAGSRSF
ncbi:MAG: hypothetical protein E6848_41425, partial [Bradyrhizobium sp.]|nr:hypothetical protein [Bradyrhizobium sp.]